MDKKVVGSPLTPRKFVHLLKIRICLMQTLSSWPCDFCCQWCWRLVSHLQRHSLLPRLVGIPVSTRYTQSRHSQIYFFFVNLIWVPHTSAYPSPHIPHLTLQVFNNFHAPLTFTHYKTLRSSCQSPSSKKTNLHSSKIFFIGLS